MNLSALNLPSGNIATGSAPLLQWHNGLSKASHDNKDRFTSFVGWGIETTKDPLLDEAARDAKIAQVRIRHMDGTIKTHWNFGEVVALYPLTAGPLVKDIKAALRGDMPRRMAEAGIVVEWPSEGFNGAPGRSHAAIRGFLVPLWDAGYRELVQLGAKGMMTNKLLDALADHCGRVAIAVKNLLGEQYPPAVLQLLLEAGGDVTVGKEPNQSTITTFQSAHPAEITKEYAQHLVASEEIAMALNDHWDDVQAWAREALVPRTPQITEVDASRQIAGPSNVIRGYLDMRAALEAATSEEEIEAIRLEALDARDAGRITASQQMAVAEEAEERKAKLFEETAF